MPLNTRDLRHAVVGPSELVREDGLEVFPLEQHLIAKTPGQPFSDVQWRFVGDVVHAAVEYQLLSMLSGFHAVGTSALGRGLLYWPPTDRSGCGSLDGIVENELVVRRPLRCTHRRSSKLMTSMRREVGRKTERYQMRGVGPLAKPGEDRAKIYSLEHPRGLDRPSNGRVFRWQTNSRYLADAPTQRRCDRSTLTSGWAPALSHLHA